MGLIQGEGAEVMWPLPGAFASPSCNPHSQMEHLCSKRIPSLVNQMSPPPPRVPQESRRDWRRGEWRGGEGGFRPLSAPPASHNLCSPDSNSLTQQLPEFLGRKLFLSVFFQEPKGRRWLAWEAGGSLGGATGWHTLALAGGEGLLPCREGVSPTIPDEPWEGRGSSQHFS